MKKDENKKRWWRGSLVVNVEVVMTVNGDELIKKAKKKMIARQAKVVMVRERVEWWSSDEALFSPNREYPERMSCTKKAKGE